jgi:hypothetical protein
VLFTIYAHYDTFDQLSPPVTPIRLPGPSWAHDSTTLTLCCRAYHRRTSIVFNTSKMRWLGASWTLKFTGVRMRCYNNYTDCLSISVLTSNLRSWAFLARSSATSLYLNSSVAQYLPSRALQSQDNCLLAVPRTKTVFGSHTFCVAAPTIFDSLPQDIRSTDIYILSPIKDVLFPQSLRLTLVTSPAPQIQHALLTLRA